MAGTTAVSVEARGSSLATTLHSSSIASYRLRQSATNFVFKALDHGSPMNSH
jgi:hypothetical protein